MGSNKNVVLIGMPGAGKSTVGVLLAKRLNFLFLDTDIYIQTQEGKSLQEIIQTHGTEGFCDIEERHILSVDVTSHVIAPGGSVVYRPKAMEHLGTNGVIIHLDLELERLKKRLNEIDARGVVIAPGQKLEALYAKRQPLYSRYADFTVFTDGLTPDQVVEEIVEIIANSK
ncbi:MAG: shikimate kinase [Desulfobacterales bacterium]|jgi:shikimate kinase